MWKLYFIVVSILQLCSAFRILVVFPIPGGSHSILGEGYVRRLLNAGHEITYVTPILRIKPSSKLHLIDVSNNFKLYSFEEIFNIRKKINKEIDLDDFYSMKNMMVDIANATITNPNVKKLMEDPSEKFDAVIVDWLYTEIYSGFSLVFNCPLIWASSMDPHAMVFSLIDDVPNPAYTAGHLSSIHPPFTFWQKVKELWDAAYIMKVLWVRVIFSDEVTLDIPPRKLAGYYISYQNDLAKTHISSWSGYENATRQRLLKPKEMQIYNEGFDRGAKIRGTKFVPLNEMMYKGSLMLGNSHVSFGQPLRLPQNYKQILGYHIPDSITPLPEVIQRVMDNATNGVIYFSLGSLLKSKTFPMQLKRDLFKIFSELKQTVIWKLEETISDMPDNVHTVNFAPQTSVLGHPNCVLFISHGGLLSLTEAVHFAVPIIGVPAFGDQFLNVDRAVRKGFGRKVDLDMNFAVNLKNAIEEVLSNSSYREKARQVSWTYHHRPISPGAELVHWVEHVIKTKGAPHLRSAALHIPLYKKLYLDLAGFFVAITTILVIITKRLLRQKTIPASKKYN